MKEFVTSLIISAIAVLAPVHSILIVTGILIVLDFITGIWAAYKREEKIKSARMRDSVTKMVIFQVAVISGFLMEKYLLDNSIPVSKIVAGVIAATEGLSLFENLNTISGKNVFGALIEKLGSKNK